jgi:hypothetical protein
VLRRRPARPRRPILLLQLTALWRLLLLVLLLRRPARPRQPILLQLPGLWRLLLTVLLVVLLLVKLLLVLRPPCLLGVVHLPALLRRPQLHELFGLRVVLAQCALLLRFPWQELCQGWDAWTGVIVLLRAAVLHHLALLRHGPGATAAERHTWG